MCLAPPGNGAPALLGGAPQAHPAGQTHTEPAGCHHSRPGHSGFGPITRDRVTTSAGGSPTVEESVNLAIPAQEATMRPPSTTPTVGEARAHEGGHGYGMVLFGSILLVVIGCFNLIYGIAAIAQSHVFVANAHYVVGNLRTWGWITLFVGILQLLAAAGVLAGNQVARWAAVVMLALNAIDQMF